jgi:phosphoribosylglycinamide formyltransferase-1
MTDGRVAVLVSGGGTNLQALIDAQKKGIIRSGRIVLVVSSNPDAYALTRAKKADIPTFVAEKGANFEKSIIAAIEEAKADFIVLAGFMKILSADFVRRYERRIINVHPALIPSFCGEGFYGLKVHQAALDYGVKVTGATVHFVNEIPDGGEILLQKAVAVRANDTPQTLQKRVMRLAEWKLLPAAVELVSKEILTNESEKG